MALNLEERWDKRGHKNKTGCKCMILFDNWRRDSPPYPAPISSYLFNISDLNQCYRFIICNIWYHVLRCKPMLRVRIAVRKVTADEGVKSGENQ
jgi:hypothetical protein